MTSRRAFLAALVLCSVATPVFANNRGKQRVGGSGSSGKGGRYVARKAPAKTTTKKR